MITPKDIANEAAIKIVNETSCKIEDLGLIAEIIERAIKAALDFAANEQ